MSYADQNKTGGASFVGAKRARPFDSESTEVDDDSNSSAKRSAAIPLLKVEIDATIYTTAVKRAVDSLVHQGSTSHHPVGEYWGVMNEYWGRQIYPALQAHARDANVRLSVVDYISEFGRFVDDALRLSNIVMARRVTIALLRWLTNGTIGNHPDRHCGAHNFLRLFQCSEDFMHLDPSCPLAHGSKAGERLALLVIASTPFHPDPVTSLSLLQRACDIFPPLDTTSSRTFLMDVAYMTCHAGGTYAALDTSRDATVKMEWIVDSGRFDLSGVGLTSAYRYSPSVYDVLVEAMFSCLPSRSKLLSEIGWFGVPDKISARIRAYINLHEPDLSSDVWLHVSSATAGTATAMDLVQLVSHSLRQLPDMADETIVIILGYLYNTSNVTPSEVATVPPTTTLEKLGAPGASSESSDSMPPQPQLVSSCVHTRRTEHATPLILQSKSNVIIFFVFIKWFRTLKSSVHSWFVILRKYPQDHIAHFFASASKFQTAPYFN